MTKSIKYQIELVSCDFNIRNFCKFCGQLSMHLRTFQQTNARSALGWECLIIQSTCTGVFTGENYIGVGAISESSDWLDLSIPPHQHDQSVSRLL